MTSSNLKLAAPTNDLVECQRQLQRVRALLDRIAYKPGYRFSAFLTLNLGACLSHIRVAVEYVTADAEDPQVEARINCVQYREVAYLASMTDEEIVRSFLLPDEWFKLDGICVNNPHPPSP